MADVNLSNMWIIGYFFFTSFYSFCTMMVAIKSAWHTALFFPLSGDWKQNQILGQQKCRDLLAPMI